MSTETPETPSSSTPSADGGRCAKGAKGGRRGRRLFRLFLLLSAVGAGAFFLPRAFAGGGWGGERGGCHQSAQSAQDLRERAEWGASWFYDEIDATDAQRAQLDAVLDEAAPVAFGFKQESKALKGQLADALSAPQVERAALEEVRLDGMDLADRATAKGFDWLARAAAILTPAQRDGLRGEWDQRQR
ncbi:MAG: periplasmic heavy metal sensor [Deltaproteobacteria bacterium]|nr:periplasmic heavy metal sensor [Deltaproteobacteria bacterium]